jgi:myo-inositol 2-dehydrogenase / D-chiro-inositol 1-dehydrogenase
MKEHINIGLIGAGKIGRVHATNLVNRIPNARLVAVSDVYLDAAKKFGADFGIAQVFESHQPVLDNPDIDAVAICTISETHAPLITEAAKAGKHIFCEKPIALDLAKVDAALETVKKHNVKLQVGFNRRFDANFKQVRNVVQQGGIGEPRILRITSRDPAPPPLEYVKNSGGIFLDMTIHDFDMARFLMGSEVTEVYATGNVLVDKAIGEAGDIDTAIISLRFENGAVGCIDNCRQAVYGYDQRVEVFGSKGMVDSGNNTANRATVSDASGVHGALPLYFYLERYMDAYAAELQAFVNAIQKDEATPVTGQDGRAPLAIGLAALKSLKENRPVKVSEVG